MGQGHPRNLAHTDSKAVTPINPAAQKFHLLILCSLFDNSFTLAVSSMPGLMPGKCRTADANQHAAETDPVISAAVSMIDFIIGLSSFWKGWRSYLRCGGSHCPEWFGLAPLCVASGSRRNASTASAVAPGNSSCTASLPRGSRTLRMPGSAACADEPGSGRVSGAGTLESPRWPLASLASAASASISARDRGGVSAP